VGRPFSFEGAPAKVSALGGGGAVPLTIAQLEEIVAELLQRPKHEKVRVLVSKLLTDGLGAQSSDLTFEEQTVEVRGRMDALLGRTVIEFKSDLRREDFEKQLAGYLKDRKAQTGRDFVGIVTDGAVFSAHELAADRESLEFLREYKPSLDNPRGLLTWLESVVALQDRLDPEVERIKQELGRESVLYARAMRELRRLWDEVGSDPEVQVKRQLWDRLLRVAYGSDIEAPELFLQHTYLVIVAKAVATAAFVDHLPDNGRDLLDGKEFTDLGISGAVEADFFDWILSAEGGDSLVLKIARQAARFDLSQIEADVLKGLYESLIDPAQRHELGEYYTPDWLAAWVVREAITESLKQRVIDPACGSGTFLFHAIRHLAAAGKKAGLPAVKIISRAEEKIAGIDVHPVAVIFARATWLLAMLPMFEEGRPRSLSIPVYLGDALQWNARELMGVNELEILVPPAKEGGTPSVLRFPEEAVIDPSNFDRLLDTMLTYAEAAREAKEFSGWLKGQGYSEPARTMLSESYSLLCRLNEQGRNHIWGYVARNLSRPIWLSTEKQKADVVVGNPPWVRYSAMSKANQERFKEEATRSGVWVGGKAATANDLSAYFFARSVDLYMKRNGHIAFVVPYAAMSRDPYAKFRTGDFNKWRSQPKAIRFTNAWTFPSDVQPLFPVPSCVLFGEGVKLPRKLPEKVTRFSGTLPKRDASPDLAEKCFRSVQEPWPEGTGETGSSYEKKFRQGATLSPRRMVIVEELAAGRLGINRQAPRVRGRTSTQDKKPWKSLKPLEGPVEIDALRTVYLGESIGPYRVLSDVTGVIPWNPQTKLLMDSEAALKTGYRSLAHWLSDAEGLWEKYGRGSMSLLDRWDYNHALRVQFPIAPSRVVYAKAGTQPAAAIIEHPTAVIDHMLYWMACKSHEEARYLCAVLNSETARSRAEKFQAEGQFGKRHFDKAMFSLAIAEFEPKNQLHKELAAAAMHAEFVASRVEVKEGEYFVTTRNRIRKTLAEEGIAEDIDKLVEKLLGPV
jgi:methylase of polypeptide subunit release factors